MTSFDVTFGSVQDVELKATVFPANGKEEAAPLLLYFHSGGLTGGSRLGFFPSWLSELAQREGCHFFTADYRLFPTASISEIESDLVQAHSYVSSNLSEDLARRSSPKVNASKIVVCGASAGVYCALLLTLRLCEAGSPPAAFLGLYGETNIGHPFYNAFKSDEKTIGAATRQSISSLAHLFQSSRQPLLGTDGKWFSMKRDEVATDEDRLLYDQTTLCVNLFNEGVTADLFTGHQGLSSQLGSLADDETNLAQQRKMVPESLRYYFPLLRIPSNFPPTLLFHGEEDVAIPISDSEVFATALETAGVDSRFIRVEGAGSGHGFDRQNIDHWYTTYLEGNTLWLLGKV